MRGDSSADRVHPSVEDQGRIASGERWSSRSCIVDYAGASWRCPGQTPGSYHLEGRPVLAFALTILLSAPDLLSVRTIETVGEFPVREEGVRGRQVHVVPTLDHLSC